MAVEEATMASERKPSFTRNQIINATDIQRKWRSIVETKLAHEPFLLQFSGAEPKVALLSYDRFEKLWQSAGDAAELALKVELLQRLFSLSVTKAPLVSLADVIARAGITPEDLEAIPDVDLETE